MAQLLSSVAPALPARRPHAYYPVLTGLRAVAALLVFVKHFHSYELPSRQLIIIDQLYLPMSIFFLLSGFVLGTRYQHEARLDRRWWHSFIWRRIARVYPLYLLLNTAVLLYVYWPELLSRPAHTLFLFFVSDTLLRGLSSTLKYVGLPQAWSITAEECFYFTLPVLLVLWRRYGARGGAAFTIGVLFTGLLLTALCQGRPALHGFFGSFYHLFNFTYFGRIFEFILGVGLARWWNGRPLASWPGWPWRTVLSIGLMVLGGIALVKLHSPFDWYDGYLRPASIALAILYFPACMTLMLAGLLTERTWLRTALNGRLADSLGRRTYSFYLVHVGLLSLWWQTHFGLYDHTAWQLLATMAVTELVYRFIEEPARRWVLARTLPRHEWA